MLSAWCCYDKYMMMNSYCCCSNSYFAQKFTWTMVLVVWLMIEYDRLEYHAVIYLVWLINNDECCLLAECHGVVWLIFECWNVMLLSMNHKLAHDIHAVVCWLRCLMNTLCYCRIMLLLFWNLPKFHDYVVLLSVFMAICWFCFLFMSMNDAAWK